VEAIRLAAFDAAAREEARAIFAGRETPMHFEGQEQGRGPAYIFAGLTTEGEVAVGITLGDPCGTILAATFADGEVSYLLCEMWALRLGLPTTAEAEGIHNEVSWNLGPGETAPYLIQAEKGAGGDWAVHWGEASSLMMPEDPRMILAWAPDGATAATRAVQLARAFGWTVG